MNSERKTAREVERERDQPVTASVSCNWQQGQRQEARGHLLAVNVAYDCY